MRKKSLALARQELAECNKQESKPENHINSVSTIEEAAKRVAVLAPPDVSTILFEYSDLQPKKEDCFAVPPLPTAGTPNSANTTSANQGNDTASQSSINPLRSLLGYSMDDSPTHGQENEPPDEMDKEWANFMEELESSGLLQEENAEQDAGKEVDKNAQTGDVNSSDTACSEENTHADETKAENGSTEQKVMGEVEGALGWHKVLDSGTGTTYFWHSESDEVSWDAPVSTGGGDVVEAETHTPKSEDSDVTNVPDDVIETEEEAAVANTGGVENGLVPYTEDEDEKAHSSLEDGEIEEQETQCATAESEETQQVEETIMANQPVSPDNGAVEEGQAQGTPTTQIQEKKELWDKVSATVKAVKDGIGSWYDVIPEAVKLAIIAETHLDQWMFMTGQLQQSSAVEDGQLQHFWTQYERYMEEAMDWVSESLPGALSQMSYNQSSADEAAISSQHPVQSGGEYHWDGANTTYDWSSYASHAGDSQHLPPLPTEPLPPFPSNSEEVPPPPPGTDEPPETAEEDVDVNMDMSDGEEPDRSKGDKSSPKYGSVVEGFATTAQSDNHYVYLPEPDTDQKGVAINNEVSDVLDIPVASTPPPLPEQEAPKEVDKVASHSQTDKKRKLEKVVGSGMGLLGKKKKVSKVSKNLSQLMNKWQAVKQEEEERANEEDPFNVEAVEKKKIAEMEEWRLNQLKSGEAENNANFQPLKGDWRSMIRRKEKKRAVQEPKKKSTSESLEDTSNGLPGGWKALVDEVSGEVYYGNVDTMETRWERPES